MALTDGTPTGGVHRTYLREDGGKADDMRSAKMMLGPSDGGVVMLAPISGDGVLGVAEGTVKSRCARARARLAALLGYLKADTASETVNHRTG